MMPGTPTVLKPQGRNPRARLPEEALLRAGPVRWMRLSVPGSGCLRRPIQSESLRCFFRSGPQERTRGRKKEPEVREAERVLEPKQALAAVMRLAQPLGQALMGPPGPVLKRVLLPALQLARLLVPPGPQRVPGTASSPEPASRPVPLTGLPPAVPSQSARPAALPRGA